MSKNFRHAVYHIAALTAAALSAACSTQAEYQAYAAAHQSQAQSAAQSAASQTTAEIARYTALSQIANSSADPTSRVAAVMAIAMDGRANTGRQSAPQSQIVAPSSNAETVLRWAQVVVPGVTALYGIRANALTAMNASDNAAATSASTNNAFVGIAGRIQAPAANVTTNTLSGTGVLGTGSYTNTPTTTTTTSSMGGSGVLGSGAYSPATTDNHASTSSTPGRVCAVDSLGTLVCQ